MFQIHNMDCIEFMHNTKDKYDFSIFSPPFADLYVYSDSPNDLGNCKDYNEFEKHYEYFTQGLSKVIKDGRIVAIHCADLPIKKGVEGYIGLRDFSGLIITQMQKYGFIYHDRITIWKNPVTEMQRTKALGLLHKQVIKDATMSRTGTPDYLLIFRQKGENQIPVTHYKKESNIPKDKLNELEKTKVINVDNWQKIASPVWFDINQSNTLQKTSAREHKDEKHICPLQLDVIERALKLWTNPNEVVFSPFAGIGSEGYMSLLNNRKFVGIELKKSYYEQANKNLTQAEKLSKQNELF